MSYKFNTIAKRSAGIYKEKGSKFIGYAIPIEHERDLKENLEAIKTEHHKARHHCYAYRLGTDKKLFRANDDGEPSGTAGRPILGQIDSYGLTNVLVVVVRYFGGTLLGTSGLIRSYKNAVGDALNNAYIVERSLKSRFQLKFGYPLMNEVMALLKAENVNFINQTFELDCEILVEIESEHEPALREKFEKLHDLYFKLIGTR